MDYERLQPDGADLNTFNYAAMKVEMDAFDKSFAEAQSLGCEMIAGFHGLTYGDPQWLWKGSSWEQCDDRQAAEVAKMFAAIIEHANHGKKGNPSYQLNLKYVELGNEPLLDDANIGGYAKMAVAIGQRIHRDYPGVKLVAFCQAVDWRHVRQFIDAVGPNVDAFSSIPTAGLSTCSFRSFNRSSGITRRRRADRSS